MIWGNPHKKILSLALASLLPSSNDFQAPEDPTDALQMSSPLSKLLQPQTAFLTMILPLKILPDFISCIFIWHRWSVTHESWQYMKKTEYNQIKWRLKLSWHRQ